VPLVKVITSAELDETDDPEDLLRELSKLVAVQTGKDEDWVMTCMLPGVPMTFGGMSEPACYVEVKNIGGFTREQSKVLSDLLCAVLSRWLDVPTTRIYIEFAAVEGHLWGWDSSTFDEEDAEPDAGSESQGS